MTLVINESVICKKIMQSSIQPGDRIFKLIFKLIREGWVIHFWLLDKTHFVWLTLSTRSSVWNLKKMPVISVYWLAAQQQASTCRRQKSRSIYSKFNAEDNELTPSFQDPEEMA